MKATLHASAGLIALLVLSSISYGQVGCSPVFRVPYRQAPDCYNSGFYLVDPWGRLTGPHYYLVPPTGPFNGILPGPIGNAIMSGHVPHHLLKSKEAMTIGNAPLLGKKPEAGGGGPMPTQYGGPPMPNPNTQTPYGYTGMPFNGVLPPYAGGPMPYGAGPMPYGAGPPPMAGAPGAGFQQFAPTQQFNPFAPTQPFAPVQPFNPMQQFQPFSPYAQFTPMQAPRMDMPSPQQPMFGGNSFPTHPFTRSPRDFFMWGENMEDERARGNRPFPVP